MTKKYVADKRWLKNVKDLSGKSVKIKQSSFNGINTNGKEGVISKFDQECCKYEVDFLNGFQGYYARNQLELLSG